MAQAIARRMVKKMVNYDSSSKSLLFRKTFMSNSGSTFGRIPNIQQLSPLLTNKNQLFFLHPCATTRRNFMSNSPGRIPYHFLHPSATTTRRNFFSLPGSDYDKHHYYKKRDIILPEKYYAWIMVPAVIIGFIGSLENFVVPYCRPDPDIDREDHVRYCFKLEKRVREKDVQYKIVDNSILELSYMYRRDPDRRIVKKQLPKGNYADAELRGWLDKFDVFRVDISGFQREPTKKQQLSAVPGGILALIIYMVDEFLPPFCRQEPVIDREDQVRYRFSLEKDVRQEDVKFKIVDNSVLELSYMYRDYTKRRIVNKELPKGNYANAEVKGWLDKYDIFLVDISGFEREPRIKQQLSDSKGTSS